MDSSKWLRAGLVSGGVCGIVEAQEGEAGVWMSGPIEREQRVIVCAMWSRSWRTQ